MATPTEYVKISEVDADASPTSDDLLLSVNDPSGTPASKKVTVGGVFIGGLPNLANATALAAPDKDDLLPVVDDPSGTPVARKATVGNVVAGGLLEAIKQKLGSVYWSREWEGGTVARPASAYAAQDELPTSLLPCDAFETGNANPDETIWLHGRVPYAYQGTGTLKLAVLGAANNATSKTAALSVKTAFITAGAGESADSFSIDANADTATWTSHNSVAYAEVLAEVTLTPATTPAAGDLFRIALTVDASESTLNGTDFNGLYYWFYEAAP